MTDLTHYIDGIFPGHDDTARAFSYHDTLAERATGCHTSHDADTRRVGKAILK